MNRRSVMGVMVMAAALVSSQAVYAAPTAVHVPVNAMYGKIKMVKFTLRNDSKSTINLKAGDNAITIAAGKSQDVKLPEGAQIVATEATPNHEAGSVVATVSNTLDGNTLAVK